MSYSCPVNFETVDSYVARFVAFLVSSLLVVYMSTFDIFILYALFLDFVVRLFYEKKYSVVFQIARYLKKVFKLKNCPTDGGAKRLAGYFGIFFISLLIVSNYLNLHTFSMIVSVVFLTCALLEAFFSYCVGCKIYYIIKKIFPKFMS
jgi:hypothetical protein